MIPNQQTIVLSPDPMWFFKLLMVAALLAVVLTIGARIAKARRNKSALSFVISLAALFAGHFATPISVGPWGLFAAFTATMIILCLGIRYLLVTNFFASFSIALAAVTIIAAGLFFIWQIGLAAGIA